MLQKNNLDASASLSRDTPRLFVLKRLESTCDAFEARWKQAPAGPAGGPTGVESGLEPDLGEFLALHDFPDSELFLELLQIDMAYRKRVGLPTPLDEYARRFPEYGDVLQKVGSEGGVPRDESSPPVPVLPDIRPIVPDRYRLEEELGQGSFGVVWKAWDTRMGRAVAVKCLRHDLSAARFDLLAREVHAVSQMSHPNVVRALDAGQGSRGTFIVFELVDGISLQEWASQLSPGINREQEVIRMVLQICRGLQHIHDQGVIHRDLKPGNILVTRDGTPKIIDFGLSKYENVLSTLTGDGVPGGGGGGALLGTVPYMSPEQCLGRPLDATTDVYSLGVILFELLTGRRPFDGGPREELIQKILNGPSPHFDKQDQLNTQLESICRAAMSRDVGERYPSASALAEDLDRFLNAQPVLRRTRPFASLAAELSRHGKSGAVAITLLAAGLLAHSFGLMPHRKGKPEVIIETYPRGAAISVIPVDRAVGQLHPEQMQQPAQRSPVSLSLPAGDYLIVAALTDGSGRFHEVYRHVPTEEEARGGRTGFRHLRWDIDSGGDIRLPAIEIPKSKVTEGMVRVEGTPAFQSGIPGSRINPASHCSIPTFFVDPAEFSLKDYRKLLSGKSPANSLDVQPREGEGSVSVSFEEAVARAEDAGKRLLEETEFEFVSTARGEFRFPWGDEPPADANAVDRFMSGSAAIFGLCSGHAEWTDTARTTSGQPSVGSSLLATSFPFLRSVRGGGSLAFDAPQVWEAGDRDPRARTLVGQFKVHPGVGFRCARSAVPRLHPGDFVQAVPSHNTLAENSQGR